MGDKREIKYIYGKSADNLLSLTLILCLLGPGIQFTLNALFGYGFNLFLVEAGVFMLFVITLLKGGCGLKVNNNIFTAIFVGIIYFLSLLISNSSDTTVFLGDFIRNCSIIVVVLMFRINYQLVFNQAKWVAVFDVVLIEIMLIVHNAAIIDYMTFGFHFMFALSFLFLYCYERRNIIGLCVCCVMCMQMLTYSARSNWYMTAILFLILLFGYTKRKATKICGSVLIIIGLFYYNQLLNAILNFLATNFSATTYAVRNLQRMLLATNASDILGRRSDIYSMAITAMQEHPFGMGVGGFSSSYALYPHNLFFDIWITFGMFFETALIVYLFYIVVMAFRANGDSVYKFLLTWSLINFSRLLTTHTFVCEPVFFLVVCLSINGLQRRQCDDNGINTYIQ